MEDDTAIDIRLSRGELPFGTTELLDGKSYSPKGVKKVQPSDLSRLVWLQRVVEQGGKGLENPFGNCESRLDLSRQLSVYRFML